MKRRKFLQTGSALSLPFFVGGMPFTAVGRNALMDLIGSDNDKVMVLVQLQGGNDGLSTIIPVDQYDNLNAVRSNVLVPRNAILDCTDTVGFHPAMGGMKEVWDSGLLNIIQGVAYPDQNRSHFRSTDIWHTASEPDEFLTTGWMGRYFDLHHSDIPTDYPNEEFPDPFALSIGTIVSETCEGMVSNYSLALTDPFDPGSVNVGEQGTAPDNCYGRELNFIREIARQTNAYSDNIKEAAEKGNSMSDKYPRNNALATKLQSVARLISGGLQTKIYVVQLGGFDLHSQQAEAGDTRLGRQTDRLQLLSDAICAFQDDCIKLGIDQRVVGMTYSEFGRRIRSNESLGTDHGTAAPIMVFGSCVNPEIIGDNPIIERNVDVQEGVPMQFDFRSVYATMLMDWFGISEERVRQVLFKDFQYLPIISCATVADTEELSTVSLEAEVYPNPFDNYFTVSFYSSGEDYRIILYDSIGSQLRIVSSQRFAEGRHKIRVPSHDLSSGIYFIRIAGKATQKTIRVTKA